MVKFAKYHGLGNDYLFLDAITHPEILNMDLKSLAVTMSHRRLGPGADGIVIFSASEIGDIKMRIFNSDGSEAENCGNALRCLGRICHETNLLSSYQFNIETQGGLMRVMIQENDPAFSRIGIDLGVPEWEAVKIPVLTSDDPLHGLVKTECRTYDASFLSVGNPHCVLFVDTVNLDEVLSQGPIIEKLPMFPEKINVGFCKVTARNSIHLTVWERGAGLTGACGTGATAAYAAAFNRGYVDDYCEVIMPGGSLEFKMTDSGTIQMFGPATYVYSGIWLEK